MIGPRTIIGAACAGLVTSGLSLTVALSPAVTRPAHGAPASPTHWAFLPVRRPPVPVVRGRSWVRNPIDAFVLARLERTGRAPAPPADRATLLRRVSLDLTGLPPTPAEVDAFLADRSPNAYEKVVDRLLGSPAYGERWAQHWLDVVRFADTSGYEGDSARPQAWRYRDWVVQALNADLPYDRFVREQVAGDLLEPDRFEAHVATGFLRAGPQHLVGGNSDPLVLRQEWLTEAVSGVGNAVLGLTVQCARCHDHKFDPIPQQDYYRLQAFFAATASSDFDGSQPGDRAERDKSVAAYQRSLEPMQAQIAAIEQPYRQRLRQEKLARLEPAYREAVTLPEKQRTQKQQQLARDAGPMLNVAWDELLAALSPPDRQRRAGLRKELHARELAEPPPLRAAEGIGEVIAPAPEVHLLIRGEPHAPGAVVQAGFPSALRWPITDPAGATGNRIALAQWLTDPGNPLTARVLVNRVWQHHFGQGIVATPNDFGLHGATPTDPALLDWLAATFVAGAGESPHPLTPSPNSGRGGAVPSFDTSVRNTQNLTPPKVGGLGGRLATAHRPPSTAWSLKRLHRLIVTSAAYRQQASPANGTFRASRLDGETIRDCILQASGELNRQMGGPSVRVPLEPEVYATIFTEGEPDNLWPVTPDPKQHARRSLYLIRKRNVRLPFLAVFDQPDMMTSCAARGQSVHALQALTLMNSDFMAAESRAFARRVLSEAGGNSHDALDRVYRLTLSRLPNARERAAAERFLRDDTALVRQRIAAGDRVARWDDLPVGVDTATASAWADLCLAQFNLNEFIYPH